MLNMFKRKTTLVISERDPEYKVKYLGNVLTAFVKADGCVDKPTQVLWNNYLSNCANSPSGSSGLDMEMRICASGLKVTTKEQGLTEYRAHRITYSICPKLHPKLFIWVYRHDGKKLKPEVRCHAVLCKTEQMARTIATQLHERRTKALAEFRREKNRRQNSRRQLLSRSNSMPSEEVTCPSGGGDVRTMFLKTGHHFRPSIDRSTSAPKLGSITEGIEEEPGTEDTMTAKRRNMLSYVGISMDRGSSSSRLSDTWLTEEFGDTVDHHDDNDGDVTRPGTVTFSIAGDHHGSPHHGDHHGSSRAAKRLLESDDTVFIDEQLVDVVSAMNLEGMASNGDDDVTDVSVEMLPGAGLGTDSDDDSAESGFSEQDAPALDS